MTYHKKISASMRERKRMAFALQIKSIDTDGRFAGYASVFDIIDNQKDVMMQGAFANTLKNGPHAVKLLWQHQQDEPIGIFERAFEDGYGLYVEGRLLLDVQKAREAHALLKARAVSGLSIGYSPVRYKIDAATGVRMLAEVDLFEVSLVTFPANSAATETVVKSSPSPIGGGPGWGHPRKSLSKQAPLLTSPLLGEEHSPSPVGGGPGRGHPRKILSKQAPLLTSPLLGEELTPLSHALDRAISILRT